MPIRVLLVDDNPDFIEAAEKFLAMEGCLEIVGCASSGQEAIKQAAALRPALILMDYVMPGLNGLEATREIKNMDDAPAVIILTMHENPAYRAQCEAVGADGFVVKKEFTSKLIPLILNIAGVPTSGGEE